MMHFGISDIKKILSKDSQNSMISNNSQETFGESSTEETQNFEIQKPIFMVERFDSKQYTRDKIEKYKEVIDEINTIKNLQNYMAENLVDTREKIDQVEANVDKVDKNVIATKKIMGEAYDSHSKNNYATIKTGATVTGGTVGAVGGPIGILAGLGLARFFASLATKWMKGRNKNQINKMENDLKTANQK